jgi:enoyl-CoA hydratase/carnithine racemase
MYDALVDACDAADAGEVRVLVIRGAGGAFAAGTDIAQFQSFATGTEGIEYERRLDTVIDRLERVNKVTLAAVDGPAVGGGCAIAVACDLRICSDRARFGVPIAKTLGNCVSAANLARLVDLVGPGPTLDLLLTGRLLDADDALRLKMVTRVVAAADFEGEVSRLATDLTRRAASTIAATKEMMRRMRQARRPPAADDIVAACYGSADFREGVAAFVEGRRPAWRE